MTVLHSLLLLAALAPSHAATAHRAAPAAAALGARPVLVTAPARLPALSPLLPAAGLDAPALRPPAAALSAPAAVLPAAAAPVPAADSEREAGRPALESLARELPAAQVPAASDLDGQKEFSDRSFELKLGGPAEAAVPAPAARRRREPAVSPTKDDGGGADYPVRQVEFNGRSFPAVALAPNISVEEKLIEAIDAAESSIRIALYEFKLRGIMGALMRARQRGVRVEIILDYSNVFPRNEPGAAYRRRRSAEIWALIREGFEFSVLRGVSKYGINHNKFAVFDGRLAEFGSYNWSFTAERSHYENANFSADPERVAALSGYWEYLRGLSVPFAQAKDHDWPKTVPAPPEAAARVLFNGVSLPAAVFTPDGSVFEDTLVAAIDAAEESVDAAVFAVRSTKLARALARARARGRRVRVIFDESQAADEYFAPYAAWLAAQGVELRVLAGPDPESEFPLAEKMHHKFMLLDGKLVETGSANWTKRASMDNFEQVHFLDHPLDAAAFAFAFAHMFARARPYPEPVPAPEIPTDEELAHDILNPPPDPRPEPPRAPRPAMPAPREILFHGARLPSFALLPYHPIEASYVRAIDATEDFIQLALYEFTSEPILAALRRAQQRGVRVEIVLDRSHLYTSGTSHTGEPRRPKPQVVALAREFDLKLLRGRYSGIMHNKFAVFDGRIVSFGSFNPTAVSEDHHFENLVFSDDRRRVSGYSRYFSYMRALAEDVDFDKLEEILTRTNDSGSISLPEDTLPESAGEDAPTGDPPSPPQDEDHFIEFNGERFPLQLFSPKGGIEAALIQAIRAARFSIEIAMFSFYSQAVADALLAARRANPELQVRILLDDSQARLSKFDDWFAHHGFETRLVAGPDGDDGDPMFQKMHNKFMLVDGALLETGSFNYSPNAENHSFENANFIDDPTDLAGYVAYFERLWLLGWKAAPPVRRRLPLPETAGTPD